MGGRRPGAGPAGPPAPSEIRTRGAAGDTRLLERWAGHDAVRTAMGINTWEGVEWLDRDRFVDLLDGPCPPRRDRERRRARHRAGGPARGRRRGGRIPNGPTDRAEAGDIEADATGAERRPGRHRPTRSAGARRRKPMGRWTAVAILAAAQFVMVLDSSVMNVVDLADRRGPRHDHPGRPARDHRVHARHGRVHARRAPSSATSGAATGPSRSASRSTRPGRSSRRSAPTCAVLLFGWSLDRGAGRGPGHPGHRRAHRGQLRGQGARARLRDHRRRRGGRDRGGPLIGGWVTTTWTWRYRVRRRDRDRRRDPAPARAPEAEPEAGPGAPARRRRRRPVGDRAWRSSCSASSRAARGAGSSRRAR